MTHFLLLHGFLGQPGQWQRLQAELVGRGHTTRALLLPRGTWDADLAAVDDAVEAAGVPTVIVGHSLGGSLVRAFAVTRPGVAFGLGTIAAPPPGFVAEFPRGLLARDDDGGLRPSDIDQWLDLAFPGGPADLADLDWRHPPLAGDEPLGQPFGGRAARRRAGRGRCRRARIRTGAGRRPPAGPDGMGAGRPQSPRPSSGPRRHPPHQLVDPRDVTSEVMTRSNSAMSAEIGALVAAAKAGDRGAFDELVKATYAQTYTLALRLTHDPEDARDVVQETYLRAYKGLKKYRGDAQFTTWLYRITANCAATHLTKGNRHRHDDLDAHEDLFDERPDADPEARADASALRDRLEVALAHLPPRLRAVVVLRDVYDLPHDQIAEELGISEAAAKVRLHRARKQLRERLFPLRSEEQARAV